MPTAFFKNTPSNGTSSGFKGELTNANGQREVDFDNEVVTIPDGTIVTDATECCEYSCATYDAAPGGGAKNIVLQTSAKGTGTINSGNGAQVRALTQAMMNDVKEVVVKLTRK